MITMWASCSRDLEHHLFFECRSISTSYLTFLPEKTRETLVNGCEIDFLELCFEIQLFLCLNLDLRSVARFPTAALKTRSCRGRNGPKTRRAGRAKKCPLGPPSRWWWNPWGPQWHGLLMKPMGFNGKFNAGYTFGLLYIIVWWYTGIF